jgi:hypothetical protein
MLTIMMILMMNLAGFFVTDVDTSAIAIMCSILVILCLSSLLGLILYASAPRCMSMGKNFSHFICHHKGGAGSFARLLKVVLQEKLGAKKRVFIDCDDLQDIGMLFEYVGSQSETIVVLMSKELLLRPWCIGELVTAHLKCKESQVATVRFPDFDIPKDKVIEDYGALVDISCLAPYGLDLAMVQSMLRWICDLPPRFTIPPTLDLGVINECRDGLLTFSSGSSKGHRAKRPNRPSVGMSGTSTTSRKSEVSNNLFIVPDYSNMEMVSTGFVLMKLLTPHFAHNASMVPRVIPQGQALPSTTQTCIFILSNGVFTNPDFMHTLILAGELRTCFIPIISEDGFRFPTDSMVSELMPAMPALLQKIGSKLETQAVITLIRDVFKEIAVVFAPQDYSSTELLLNVKAKDVVTRLTNSSRLQRLSVSSSEVLDPDSKDALHKVSLANAEGIAPEDSGKSTEDFTSTQHEETRDTNTTAPHDSSQESSLFQPREQSPDSRDTSSVAKSLQETPQFAPRDDTRETFSSLDSSDSLRRSIWL